MKQVKVLDLLMDGLEELTLVFPNFGMVNLLHQLGVFVDEPRFPEYVGSSVFHLGETGINTAVNGLSRLGIDHVLSQLAGGNSPRVGRLTQSLDAT